MAQCIGPQFRSPSEIDALVRLAGADVVGMTLGPESRLIAGEPGIPHRGDFHVHQIGQRVELR